MPLKTWPGSEPETAGTTTTGSSPDQTGDLLTIGSTHAPSRRCCRRLASAQPGSTTCVTRMPRFFWSRGSIDPRVVQELMGWSPSAMAAMAGRYQHVVASLRQEAAAKVGKNIFGTG